MKTYEVFWQNNSNEIATFPHKQIEHLINADIIGYDFDSNTYHYTNRTSRIFSYSSERK